MISLILILQSNTNASKKTWIGFAVNIQAVQWQWTDQGPITYTNWYQNTPVTAGCINGVAPWGNGNGCADFQPTGSGCDGGSNYWENFYSCATALPFVYKQTPICGGAGVSTACINSACNAACINRGCQSGFCNIGCPNPSDPTSPCNPTYQYTCTCAFCGTTPCAQQGGPDNKIWQTTCSNIGCQSGDCHEGVTQCVGCPGATGPTSTNMPSPVTTNSMGNCNPTKCNKACQAHDVIQVDAIYFIDVLKDFLAVPFCVSSSCMTTCTNMGCQRGSCDQGMCGCFNCPFG
uniref:C-type lectin domain-containing protein n=1 Tax=Acrobeloides nanus TaxID=290746 RepID=A0A914DE70_9BILA